MKTRRRGDKGTRRKVEKPLVPLSPLLLVSHSLFISVLCALCGHSYSHSLGNSLMLLNNAGDGRFIRFRGIDSSLMSAAQKYAVAPWEHIALGRVHVIDLRLWRQERQLSFYRDQFFVIEERLRAESRAINNHLLLQLHDRRDVTKVLHDDPTARCAEIG